METDDKTPQEQTEVSFAAAIEASPAIFNPAKGDKIRGKIIAISEDAVLVDCGARSEAVLDPAEIDDLKIGDEIEAIVLEDDPLTISRKLTDSRKADYSHLHSAFAAGIPVEGKITAKIKGGFDVDVAGVRAFLPHSHLDLHFINNTEGYIGQTYEFKIIELSADASKFVVSRAALLKVEVERRAEETWKKIEPGVVLTGKVRSIQDFGAFVDLGGVDGLVHISELSLDHTSHPSEVLTIGQEVQVKVLKADHDKNRIALSMKELAPNPWEINGEKLVVGEKIAGTIVRKTDFGMFVQLYPGIDGLIHVSQLLPNTELSDKIYDIGQNAEGWIRSVDREKKRVGLTLKAPTAEVSWQSIAEKYPADSIVPGIVEEATQYGVFVELETNVTGLMPLSELKQLGFRNLNKDFPPQSKINVKVTTIDTERKRISLLPEGIVPSPDSQDHSTSKPRTNKRRSGPEQRSQKPQQQQQNSQEVTAFGAALAAALHSKK